MTYLDVQLDWRVILYFVLGERDDEMVGEGFNSRGLSSLSLLSECWRVDVLHDALPH